MRRTSTKTIDPKKTAVLVIDFQNDFCHRRNVFEAKFSRNRKAAEKTFKFIEEAKKKGIGCIFTQQIYDESKLSKRQERYYAKQKVIPCKKGSFGAKYFKFNPPKDYLFTKYNFDIWQNKQFMKFLDKNNIDSLIITGVELTCCVLFAILGADERGFNIIIPRDLVSENDSWTEEYNSLLKILDRLYGPLTTSKEILKSWSIVHCESLDRKPI